LALRAKWGNALTGAAHTSFAARFAAALCVAGVAAASVAAGAWLLAGGAEAPRVRGGRRTDSGMGR
jgi:hypothetical protein